MNFACLYVCWSVQWLYVTLKLSVALLLKSIVSTALQQPSSVTGTKTYKGDLYMYKSSRKRGEECKESHRMIKGRESHQEIFAPLTRISLSIWFRIYKQVTNHTILDNSQYAISWIKRSRQLTHRSRRLICWSSAIIARVSLSLRSIDATISTH